LFIVKWIFYSFYLLVFFVSFSCDEQDVFGGGEVDGGTNGLFAVGDRDIFSFCRRVEPASISRMICSGSSLRGLSEVKITLSLYSQAAAPMSGRFVLSRSPPAAHDGDDPFVPFAQFLDSDQHIDQGIGCMSIVDDPDDLFFGDTI
jgi:hypothetical protein